MSAHRGPETQSPRPWYRQPVLWLGAVLLSASLGGCVLMIVLGARYADEPLPTAGQVFKVPLARPAAPPEPPPPPPQ